MKLKTLFLLINLAKRGAIGREIMVTLRELAKELNVSPQTVLRWLDELEELGYVSRKYSKRGTSVQIKDEGMKLLETLYEELSSALYRGIIIGEVVSGIGEGAYYVQQYAPLIREYLGFDPYPGTLNVKVIFPKTIFDALCNARPIIIPGFVKDGRTFGDVRAYRVRIDGIEGAIVIPSRTIHPPKIAEIIAPVNLRKTLNLKDGDRIRIEAL
ncbi:riboflavin kinase [Thermococcus chitonophagus]|uniref:Riboflavin kinase n=1 Tax=Thermococcus chitonophagus TaxID=54262 RepID=A0A161KAB6_9EURY|nr:DUF120 domain-containing protein [Thermococcus chitonophagus]ASJ16647.1 riboflavin kinase [Thermococcus chitonophagus]CUX77428.1 DNA-binding HTH domain in riboflavin kinase / CTP-dependent archaeal riboflavin kinase [Thermococcus chitonophagus]